MSNNEPHDFVAICRLLADYCLLLELGDLDAWGELFEPEAELSVYGKTWRGRERIKELISGAPAGIHLGGLPIVDVDGDTARGIQNYIFIDPAIPETRIGWYHDQLARSGGSWRFRSRAITFLTATGISEKPH
jgi:hypothetical protein